MGLIQVLFILIVFGVILYLINRFIPMDAKIKNILNIFVVIVVVLWLASLVFPGLFSSFQDIRVN